MRADSIDISNFRRFEIFHCAFDPSFTLLMGPNGSGKTSLLRAIHFALLSLGSFASVHLGGNITDSDVHRLSSIDPADESWRTLTYPCRVKLWVDLAGGRELLGMERQAQGTETLFTDEDREQSLASYQIFRTESMKWFDPAYQYSIPLIARYSAANATGSSQPGAVQKPFETKQGVWQRFGVEVVETGWLAQWFQYNELRTLQERKAPLIYHLVKQAVLSAIHAQDIRYVVRDNKLMLLHEHQGWRPFDELSDGQRRIAAIFCDLALRCASLNSHLGEACITSTSGIVTIDELDLHLHPAWQRSVVSDLRRVFPSLQFIVTSHSPFLLQAAFEQGRVVDMRTGEFAQAADTSIEDITEGVMGVAQPQRSQRFLTLRAAAENYLNLLESTPGTADELAQIKLELDHAMAVFANDPASAAWLMQRREASGI